MDHVWIISGSDADYNAHSFIIGVFDTLNEANRWLKESGTERKFYPQCISAAKYTMNSGIAIKKVRGYPLQET